MIQIRKGVFETNSSSTHSLAVPKKHYDDYPNFINFTIGEFGWEWGTANSADYLYTAIMIQNNHEENLQKLKDILTRHGIGFKFSSATYDKYDSLNEGYIDHGYELCTFVDSLLDDDERTLNFIFYGLVITGNDNSDAEDYYKILCFEPTYEAYENGKWVKKPNSYFKQEYLDDYDWFNKGN